MSSIVRALRQDNMTEPGVQTETPNQPRGRFFEDRVDGRGLGHEL
jgi:hypothetical protein